MSDAPPANSTAMTRRDALKKSALFGLGLSLGQASSAKQIAHNAGSRRKLGVALVGLGNYSSSMLGPALRETERCELRGIVTGTPAKAEQWASEYGIPDTSIYDYASFDRIADNPDIDIVYVVLPNFMHAEYTIRAAQAGKHVICEKPMAMNVAECQEMIDACHAADRRLSIGYRLRFDPFHREAIRWARDTRQGPLKLIEASLGFNYPDPESWRFKIKEGGGGSIMDLGVYCIQAARYLSGEEPTSVTAQSFTVETNRFVEIPEAYFFQLQFPSGVISHHGVTYSSYVDRMYANHRDGGSWLELNPSFQGSSIAPIGRTNAGAMPFNHINQAAAQMDDFARCIVETSPSIVDGAEGLADMKVVEAVKRAAVSGTAVAL